MALYIRADNARELAAKLAAAEHVPISEAVRWGLREKPTRHMDELDERWRRLREI
jgi:hypothetical protein